MFWWFIFKFSIYVFLSFNNRTAKILAREDTWIGFMPKLAYEFILKSINIENTEISLNFLKSLPLFSNWTDQILLKLCCKSNLKTYLRNSTVYKIGDCSTNVYIVKNGYFEVTYEIEYSNKPKIDSPWYLGTIGKSNYFLNQRSTFSIDYFL